MADTVMRIFLPSTWRRGAHIEDHDNISIDDEEGELMAGMTLGAARREALEQRRSTVVDSTSRLSRELEEGFMDDSDEEGSDGRGGAGNRH